MDTEFNKMKETVADQKKLLEISNLKNKLEDYVASSKIIVDNDADLDTKAEALRYFIGSLGVNSVKLGAKPLADIDCYSTCTGRIDSGASATIVTSNNKLSNPSKHRSKL